MYIEQAKPNGRVYSEFEGTKRMYEFISSNKFIDRGIKRMWKEKYNAVLEKYKGAKK